MNFARGCQRGAQRPYAESRFFITVRKGKDARARGKSFGAATDQRARASAQANRDRRVAPPFSLGDRPEFGCTPFALARTGDTAAAMGTRPWLANPV